MYEAFWFTQSVIIAVGIIGVSAAGAIAVTKLVLKLRDVKNEVLN
jgi:hypothetical protein